MQLTKMTEDEFVAFRKKSIDNYYQELARSSGMEPEKAKHLASSESERILPEGMKTKNQFFYNIENSEKEIVGYLWYGVREVFEVKRLFICDIFVDSNFRGQGFGFYALKWVEVEARRLNLDIQLHVFAHNTKAHGLYQRLGYVPTNIHMLKRVT